MALVNILCLSWSGEDVNGKANNSEQAQKGAADSKKVKQIFLKVFLNSAL